STWRSGTSECSRKGTRRGSPSPARAPLSRSARPSRSGSRSQQAKGHRPGSSSARSVAEVWPTLPAVMASQTLVDLCGRLVPVEHGGPPAWLLASQVEAFVARLPRHAQLAFRAGVLAAGRSSQALDAVKTVVLLVAGAEAGAVELAAWSESM